MKWLAVCVLGWVLLPVLALAQDKVELNAITSVKVNGSTVEITGSKKPNFTTFTMTDPPRLVIDISEAVLKGVPEEMRVNAGLITGLRAANYGSDSSAIARVLIGYDRDVETDIQVSGNVLAVKVLDGTSPAVAQTLPEPEQPLVAANGPTAAETQAAANQATQAAQQDRATQEKTAVEASANAKTADVDTRQQEEAARVAAAKKAEEDRRAQELAAAEAKKQQEAQARADAEAQKLAAAEAKKQQEAQARAEAEAKKQAELDEKKRKAEEAEAKRLAAIEEKKRQQEDARAEAEARKQAELDEKKRKAEEAEAKRLAAAEEKKRKLEESRAEADARKQQEAEERKRKAEEAEQKRLAAAEEKKRREEAEAGSRVASAEVPRRAEPPATSPEPAASGRRKTLEIVGFQQKTGGSRVYVRTNEPVSYKVSEGRNEIVLMLENTQIGKGNNTRALDTSFFDTAVARVDPTVGPDRSVRVSIKLKEQVSVQTRQEGNTISLEFPRPER
jgi:colicin import membrane protein